MELVLSIFPGLDLLGMGFEHEGFCVVRGPDPLWGGDVRRFFPPARHFHGIIGGPPCQDFSKARQGIPIKPYACDVATKKEFGHGVAMLREFARVVTSADPEWWLCENVPGVPDVTIPGYVTQRFNINVRELGHIQNRNRCIQFGAKDGCPLVIPRGIAPAESHRCVTVVGKHAAGKLSLSRALDLQGMSKHFRAPALSHEAIKKGIGNGVHLGLARALARAVRDRSVTKWTLYCSCGCGAPVRRGVTLATQACRKRMSRRMRDAAASQPQLVTAELFGA